MRRALDAALIARACRSLTLVPGASERVTTPRALAAHARSLSTPPRPRAPGSVTRRVVTAHGPDRAGIVQQVTAVVLSHRGNVEESRMARLRGDFTVSMLVSFADAGAEAVNIAAFADALGKIENLTTSVRASSEANEGDDARTSREYRRVLVRGSDFPGITHAFARALFERGVNIESMQTDTALAPFGNERLFLVDALVKLPVGKSSLAAFDAAMRALERDVGLDVEILPHDPIGKIK